MIPTQAENRDALNTLREAYESGLLDPPSAFDPVVDLDFPCIDGEDMNRLLDCEDVPIRIDRPFDQIDEPARDTRRLQYQDSTQLWTRGNFVDNRAWEIARFIVMPDEVGIVRQCETFLDIQEGSPSEHVYLDPTDPRAHLRHGVNVTWFLRLYQGTFQPLPPWDNNAPPASIMGYPFPELAFWNDARFIWHGAKNEVFWLVPSNHVLRLYVLINSVQQNVLKEIYGRLKGTTQPIRVEASFRNVCYDW